MKRILRVFKNCFKKKFRVIYVCDPLKNTKCGKEGCWDIYRGPCRCTSRKKLAKVDENGKPVIASDAEAANLEWLELQLFGKEKAPSSLSDL